MSQCTKIDRIETILLDLPTIRPHRLSMITLHGQTLLIVRLHRSDGIVGIGEATTIGGLAYGAESPEGMKLAIDTYMAPVLQTADPDRIGETMARIGAVVRDNRFAKCAIETALLDAFAKRSGFHFPIFWVAASTTGCRLPGRWPAAIRVTISPKPRSCWSCAVTASSS